MSDYRIIDRANVEGSAELCSMDIHEHYSGTGMAGARCFGLVTPYAGDSAIQAICTFMVELAKDDDDLVINLSDAVRWDRLGHSTIFYFPGYILEEAEDGPEDAVEEEEVEVEQTD